MLFRRMRWPRIIWRFLTSTRALPIWFLLAAGLLDVYFHSKNLTVRPLDGEPDKPFAVGCQNVTRNVDEPRENAAFVMLTRNSDLENALHSVESVERHFNKWFHYPMIFLNDEPWSEEFISAMTAEVSGEVQFEVIPKNLWGFPESMDKTAALASIKAQGSHGFYSESTKAGLETYHHMCRFYSGNFYKLGVLKPYKWYWRIEPDIDIYCDITYDPFVEMAKHGKQYGYAIAIQETARTCPSLFSHALDYKQKHQFGTTETWKAMMSPSWLPWPFRTMSSGWSNHDPNGDVWNRCHYWSNFEIADLDFFRSKQYQDFYEYLDKKGGFYFERWGDAPIHSLAIAMFMDPRKVHNFEDIGYRHDWLFQCPGNAPGGQLSEVDVLNQNYTAGVSGGTGCRCECDAARPRNFPHTCLNTLRAANSKKRSSWSGGL